MRICNCSRDSLVAKHQSVRAYLTAAWLLHGLHQHVKRTTTVGRRSLSGGGGERWRRLLLDYLNCHMRTPMDAVV
uniref:Uncharacterized protein n=1 Tax=Oryza sativa subsp. japonica TaxID=39947 RepID=Q6K756_ORYSJ|nr:hypothetical protein [Oryza sativa Japonica Group]